MNEVIFLKNEYYKNCNQNIQEELEVLKSIYESDPNFSAVNENTFQYKVSLNRMFYEYDFVLNNFFQKNQPIQVYT